MIYLMIFVTNLEVKMTHSNVNFPAKVNLKPNGGFWHDACDDGDEMFADSD
jgi:hypothetical protein